MHGTGLILGIETSCDETAAAVVRAGRETLSNVVATQMALHDRYGGVVPELAAREHLRHIVPVVREALAQAAVSFADLDAIAVTEGPGLAGALLVGITYAKALAAGLRLPLVAVNHLEGHIHAVLLEHAAVLQQATTGIAPATDAPGNRILALVVSGGHTHLYLARRDAEGSWHYRNVGRTIDDAAGEAFDKVAKLLGLGYPGGPWVDMLAQHGDPRAIPFALPQIKLKPGNPRNNAAQEGDAARFDFSFSGLKTAVLRHVQTHNMQPGIEARRAALAALPPDTPLKARIALAREHSDQATLDLIAGFQHTVVSYLIRQAMSAAEAFGASALLVSGGVAANRELRARFTAAAQKANLPIAFPSLSLATDNAAMIAAAAWPKFTASQFASHNLAATPQLKLG